MATTNTVLPSSFRDPSGFLFRQDGTLYRQINRGYRDHYDHLMQSGLYRSLLKAGLLIPHQEVTLEPHPSTVPSSKDHYKTLRPEPIPFISYPYEWCFSQHKAAALATLQIQKIALDFGMVLKDASAYNIQFKAGRPILIDTLSFETYQEGQPWVAYRQFCQHFLAPLALMTHKDIRLNQLLRIYLDGIPLDLASSLLPRGTYLHFSLLSHVHLHAKSQKRHEGSTIPSTKTRGLSRQAFLGLIDSLETAVHKLHYPLHDSTWSSYYQENTYSQEAMGEKTALVGALLDISESKGVWDLGSNTGLFSRQAAGKGIPTISFEADPTCVEMNYRSCIEKGETKILPLVLDLTNPSSSLGWASQERLSLLERGPADTILALALIHHLAIANNVPLDRIAHFLKSLCHSLIIEFVPKSDSQVQRLLSTRTDVFPDYTRETFETEFQKHFFIERVIKIRSTERYLYLMRTQKT